MKRRLLTLTALFTMTATLGSALLTADALRAAAPGARPTPKTTKPAPAGKTEPASKPSPKSAPDDKPITQAVEIKLKFPHDPAQTVLESFTWSIRNNIRQTGGPLAKPVDLTTQQTIDGTFQVLESRPDGATIEMVYTRVRFQMTLGNGRHVGFDSESGGSKTGPAGKTGRPTRPDKTAKFSPVPKPDDRADEEVVGANKVYKTLVGATLKLRFTTGGKLTSVTGMDAVREKLLKLAGDEQEASAIKAMFSDESVRSDLSELLTGFVPPSPMRIGQSWLVPTRRSVPGVGVTEWKLEHRLASLAGSATEGTASIQISGEGQHDAGTAPTPAEAAGNAPLPKLSDVTMTRTGSVEFDLKRGWLRSSKTKQTCRGNLPLGEGDPIKFSQDVDVTLSVTPAPDGEPAAESKTPAKP